MKLSHFDEKGNAKMVDVSEKPATTRTAVASGFVYMKPDTLKHISRGMISKGDVLGVARIAGIMASKKVSELIPLCHPLNLTSVKIDFSVDEQKKRIEITATANCNGQTGVEMEALTAVSVAALTIYDMCKSVDKGMAISDITLLEKTGGKSGDYKRTHSGEKKP
jgi:cyclic pyranopterin phosphate synthase